MLKVICSISLLLSGAALTACGQSGALHLPSDPNYDKRAKYLLYLKMLSNKLRKMQLRKKKNPQLQNLHHPLKFQNKDTFMSFPHSRDIAC
jgi:hypothetical protein